MQIITLKTTLTTALISLGLSTIACAGEQTAEPHQDQGASSVIADTDGDGLLSRDEFKRFVSLKAEAGDAYYTDVQDTATEDNHFSGKDIDGDGLLTTDELAYVVILPSHDQSEPPAYGSDTKASHKPEASHKGVDEEEKPDGASLTLEEDTTAETGG